MYILYLNNALLLYTLGTNRLSRYLSTVYCLQIPALARGARVLCR